MLAYFADNNVISPKVSPSEFVETASTDVAAKRRCCTSTGEAVEALTKPSLFVTSCMPCMLCSRIMVV